MCGQRIEDTSQRLLGYFEIAFDCVCAVHEHFRLDDRHQITFLTKRRITRQRLGVTRDTYVCWNSVANRDHCAPFGKARAELSIFGQSLTQSVETLGNFLAVKIRHRLGAFVHFDPRDDPLLFQRFYETAPVASLLPNRFVKENYTADKFACTGSGKQKFAICATVLLCGRNINALQSLLDRPRTLIGCQDPLPRCDQFSCYRFQGFSTHNSLLANKIITFFLAKCFEKSKRK